MKNTIFSRLPSEKYWQEQTYGDGKSMMGGKVQYSVHSTISPQDIPKILILQHFFLSRKPSQSYG